MSTPDTLAVRLEALAGRGNLLETYARRSIVGGVSALICGALCYAPNPAANEALSTAIAIPPDLIRPLMNGGAALTRAPEWLLANGGGIHPALILAIPVALVCWKLLARLIPNLWMRLAIIWTSPFWLGMLIGTVSPSMPVELMAAYPGVIADAPGQPMIAKDGTYEHLVEPIVLRPESLPPELADQGYYVLAQQAYLGGRPADVARYLRSMSGAWRPADEHSRARLGILAEYAESARNDTGKVREETSALPSHFRQWRLASGTIAVLGLLSVAAGAIFTRIGDLRVSRATRFKVAIQHAKSAHQE